jgi:hypothetical protein
MANLKNAGWGAYIPPAQDAVTLRSQLGKVSRQIGKIPKVQAQFVESLDTLNGHIETIEQKIEPPAVRDLSPSALAVVQSLNLARDALCDSRRASTDSTNTQLAAHRKTDRFEHISNQLASISLDLQTAYVAQFSDLPEGLDFEHARRARLAKLIEFERYIARTLLA